VAHKFSSTQINLPDELAKHVKAEAAKIPDWALAPEGRETEPHVTVKYGIHSNSPAETRNAIAGHGKVKIRLGRTSHFPDSGDGDVIKAEVHSPSLHRLNKKINDAVPHTDTHPDYKPHVTLAYVKRGLGRKFSGSDALIGKEASADHIVFSAKNGTKTKLRLGGVLASRYGK